MGSIVKRVLVVDDHPVVLEGVTSLLERHGDLQVCGGAADAISARRDVNALMPDIVLLDLSLGRDSGLDLIPLLVEDQPSLPILAFSTHDEVQYAKRALNAGARGYVMKNQGTEVLVHAIRTVLAGQVYVSARVNQTILRTLSTRQPPKPTGPAALGELSNRELQVYRLLGEGMATRTIARQLFLSIKTVESHRARIKEKLGIDGSPALVAHAAESLYREKHRAGTGSILSVGGQLEDRTRTE